MTECDIGSRADHRPQDYRFERYRQDRIYTPLETSQPPIRSVRWDIFAALVVVILGYLAFPAAEIVVQILAGKL